MWVRGELGNVEDALKDKTTLPDTDRMKKIKEIIAQKEIDVQEADGLSDKFKPETDTHAEQAKATKGSGFEKDKS